MKLDVQEHKQGNHFIYKANTLLEQCLYYAEKLFGPLNGFTTPTLHSDRVTAPTESGHAKSAFSR